MLATCAPCTGGSGIPAYPAASCNCQASNRLSDRSFHLLVMTPCNDTCSCWLGLTTKMSTCSKPCQQLGKSGRSAQHKFKMFQSYVDECSHLDVNDYSVVPIITAIRSTFPEGPLAIAKVGGRWFTATRPAQSRPKSIKCQNTQASCPSDLKS